MKRRNGLVIEALERQETGCFIPSDALITGRQVLKEKDFRVTEGAADADPQERWTSQVPRVLCLLEPDQTVELAGKLRGLDIEVSITRSDKFLNAELIRCGVPFRRVLIAVRTDNGRWVWSRKFADAIELAPEDSWVLEVYRQFARFN